jgi:uroporphyrinogen decarboxylase
MGVIGEVGLEQFCYYLSDCPDVIYEQLERNAVKSVQWCENLPDDHGIVAVFSGDDVAYKGGPLLSPKWFEEHYMERLSRVIGAYHYRGIKLNFHSDGDLMPIMEGLVDAGIDCLNPIETIAGMDIKEIHRRFPHLVFTGGIDVSQLLPYGSPADVRDEVNRAIQDSGGQIMIGSSTELQFTVPLENFLAMRDTVLEMLS